MNPTGRSSSSLMRNLTPPTFDSESRKKTLPCHSLLNNKTPLMHAKLLWRIPRLAMPRRSPLMRISSIGRTHCVCDLGSKSDSLISPVSPTPGFFCGLSRATRTSDAGSSNGRIRCFEHRDAGSIPAPAAEEWLVARNE